MSLTEQLRVYRLTVELRAGVTRAIGGRGTSEPGEQIERATGSMLGSLAEGARCGEPAAMRQCYVRARGSAFEIVVALTLLRATSVLGVAEYAAAKRIVIRVLQVLLELCRVAAGREVGR